MPNITILGQFVLNIRPLDRTKTGSPYGSDTKISKYFKNISQFKLLTPGMNQIRPLGYNLCSLCEGLLDKATCKFGLPLAL